MVPVVRVSSGFHARVVAARLGSEGIVTQLRGAVDTPWPVGDVEVLVPSDELEAACDLLMADELEAALAPRDPGEADLADPEPIAPDDHGARLLPFWAVALGVATLVVFVLARSMGAG